VPVPCLLTGWGVSWVQGGGGDQGGCRALVLHCYKNVGELLVRIQAEEAKVSGSQLCVV
jgi:hypothetical protein